MAFNLSSPDVVHNRYNLDVVANVVTSHLLHALILETGLVCNTAEKIESASQLKRHTYLIRPAIQGYALLPLHNTHSMFVTPCPKVALAYCHFTYCKPRPAPPLATLFRSLLLSVIVRSFSLGHLYLSSHYSNNHKRLLCKCTHSRSQ